MAAAAPLVRELGRSPYEPVWRAMQRFTAERGPETPDETWLVEHDPVFTLGLAGRPEHVLAPGDIPVVRSDRGGQVTYHGPGQAVAYVLLDLRRRGFGAKALVRRLEQAAIDVLAGYGLAGHRREGMPGVYLDDAKIAAIGLRITRGCCYHGIALNVDADLEPFARIDPCGYPGLAATRLADHGCRDKIHAVQQSLAQALARCLIPT
jgi:lipoyl(octanoyl) transferase